MEASNAGEIVKFGFQKQDFWIVDRINSKETNNENLVEFHFDENDCSFLLAKKLINLGIKNIWMEKPSSENLKKTIKLIFVIPTTTTKINCTIKIINYYSAE